MKKLSKIFRSAIVILVLFCLTNNGFAISGKIATINTDGISGTIQVNNTSRYVTFIEPSLFKKELNKGDHVFFVEVISPRGEQLAIDIEKETEEFRSKETKEINFGNNNPFFTALGQLKIGDGSTYNTSAGMILYENNTFKYLTMEGRYQVDYSGFVKFYSKRDEVSN